MNDFHIDGVDISFLALTKAKQGVYSPYSFRRQGYRSDNKYFNLGMPRESGQTKQTARRYFLVDAVREKVSFCQGNILDPQLLSDQSLYDVIFCRNLLIYFDQRARDRTFTKLGSLLRSDGLLFLGHTETSLLNSYQYQPVPYPDTFAYFKRCQKQHFHQTHAQPETSDSASFGLAASL